MEADFFIDKAAKSSATLSTDFFVVFYRSWLFGGKNGGFFLFFFKVLNFRIVNVGVL